MFCRKSLVQGRMIYSDADLLLCGVCNMAFPLESITLFMKHKKLDCDDDSSPDIFLDANERDNLFCQSCPEKFRSAWTLLCHAQKVHSLQIYRNYFEIIKQKFPGEVYSCTDIATSTAINEIGHLLLQTRSENPASLTQPPTGVNTARHASPSHQDAAMQEHRPGKVFEPRNTSECDTCIDACVCTTQRELSGEYQTDDTMETCQSPKEISNNTPEQATSSTVGQDTSHKLKDKKDSTQSRDRMTFKQTSRKQENIKTKERPTEHKKQCCSSQACGVTVMPGTHESLKKCCSAVVPKKRKRHMEIKHMGNGAKSKRRERSQASKLSSDRTRYSTTHDIFIDVNSQTADEEAFTVSTSDLPQLHVPPHSEDPKGSRIYFDNSEGVGRGEQSVIIQPGSTLSIPMSSGMSVQSVPGLSADTGRLLTSTLTQPFRIDHPTSSCTQSTTVFSNLSPNDRRTSASKTRQECDSNGEGDGNVYNQIDDTYTYEEPRSFSGNTKQMKHKKRRYPTSKPFKCDKCDDAFNQRIHLKKHQSKHTGIKPFKCNQCDYSTVERSHLKVHIRVHTGEKPFKCTSCEYATAQNSTLKIHLQRHHNQTKSVETSETPSPSRYETETSGLDISNNESREELHVSPLDGNPHAAQGEPDSCSPGPREQHAMKVEPDIAAPDSAPPTAEGSGMTMTLDSNSITFRGSGLEQVLAILGASQQRSATATTETCSIKENATSKDTE